MHVVWSLTHAGRIAHREYVGENGVNNDALPKTTPNLRIQLADYSDYAPGTGYSSDHEEMWGVGASGRAAA